MAEGAKRSVVGLIFKLLWIGFVITTPLLGVWLSGSLAAYLNGPMWAIWLLALLLFPGLPALWELVARIRRARKEARSGQVSKRFLTLADRLILRTLLVNLLFLGITVGLYPQDGFAALSTRGDWMLMGSEAPWASATRERLFQTAGGLEWLYEATRDDPFAQFEPEPDGGDGPEPVAPDGGQSWKPRPKPTGTTTATSKPNSGDPPEPNGSSSAKPNGDPPEPNGDPSKPNGGASEPNGGDPPAPNGGEPAPSYGDLDGIDLASQPWPTPNTMHPLVKRIPPEAEASIASIGKYFADNEKRPFWRVKALHDYVADRIAYDVPALSMPQLPSQAPDKVLRERKGVCSGYSLLMAALGKVTGDRIVYVGGDARGLGGDIGGGGHAWNAVELNGRWYLLDATWNAGSVSGDSFEKQYSSTYLFTPPDIFISDHIPDNDKWQLLSKPLSRGEFMRQPVLRPSFFSAGMKLLDPKRSQVTVTGNAKLLIDNPQSRFMLARLKVKGDGGRGERCQVTNGTQTSIDCAINAPGTYQVWMFAAKQRYGNYPFIGQLEVNRR